jgi:uncharacterized membrane protein/thiol-disulfide isomerase/thioredoxin
MKKIKILFTLLLIMSFALTRTSVHAQASQPIVQVVLFYSPTCPHCEHVIKETLIPLADKYGNQLQIIAIDVSQQEGRMHFLSAANKFHLEEVGVPFLVIDDTYLIGSVDIPEKFPGLVESYLAQGGVDWPDIPGLTESIKATESIEQPAPTSAPVDHPGSWANRFAQDLAGNTLAVIVLIGMIASLIWAAILFKKREGFSTKVVASWLIPLLCVIGLSVAGYLAYVETTQTTAVCGPVGDCNTVQQSDYARLFGVLPIGVLGLFGYMAIIVAWLFARYGREDLAQLAVLALFTMTALGTVFSIYLTFLEPFVIGATCAWCLTSSVLMTILLLLSIRPAKLAFAKRPLDALPLRKDKRIGVSRD